MNIAKVLIALAFSSGMAQFSYASVAAPQIVSAGNVGGATLGSIAFVGISNKSDAILFSTSSTSAFAVGGVQNYAPVVKDPIFDQAVDVADLENPNPLFNSFQTMSLNGDNYKPEFRATDSWSSGLSAAGFGVSAVPETDTWIMLIVGVGLIGYQLKRTQRSLVRAALPSMA